MIQDRAELPRQLLLLLDCEGQPGEPCDVLDVGARDPDGGFAHEDRV
ncbi:MAG: hypothetical protein M5T61_03890 [Acidimicrobiia bacterium]|nr:hypothetical protein [Acidimicrobiia bacterium]